MEITNKSLIIAVAVLFGVGYATGRYIQPAKITVKTEEKIVEHETIKYVQNINQKDNVDTVTKETINPDGTKTIETHTIDKSVVDSSTKSDTMVDKTIDKKSETTVINPTKDWNVSGLATLDFTSRSFTSYGVHVQRRVIGPIEIGIFVLSNPTVGVSVGVAF